MSWVIKKMKKSITTEAKSRRVYLRNCKSKDDEHFLDMLAVVSEGQLDVAPEICSFWWLST